MVPGKIEYKWINYKKYSLIAIVISIVCTHVPIISIAQASAGTALFGDATLKGGIYFWQRQRDRKDIKTGDYEKNLHHATWNANLDFSSGYLGDLIGFDLAGYGAVEMNDGGPAYPNEIGFSNAKNRWNEDWAGDTSGVTLYKAAIKVKSGSFWGQGGYIQPAGQSILKPHWSFMPGTYRGIETGAKFELKNKGDLAISYMWADRYKAPWYKNVYDFRQADMKTSIDYLQSIGASYDLKNGVLLEAAYGQAKNYMHQYFAKGSYAGNLYGNRFSSSYQFYGAKDRVTGGGVNDVYEGLAWLQGLTFSYETGPFNWRLEGMWVKAHGNQGYFLQRMTPSWASSNGRLDMWWNARSDWNADGEKSVYFGVDYDLKGWDLNGWKVGSAYVRGWGAKPNKLVENQHVRLTESAINFDTSYTIQSGKAKGSSFALHYTIYDNHSTIPSWQGGFNNVFQDEKDLKFIVTIPFTFF